MIDAMLMMEYIKYILTVADVLITGLCIIHSQPRDPFHKLFKQFMSS